MISIRQLQKQIIGLDELALFERNENSWNFYL